MPFPVPTAATAVPLTDLLARLWPIVLPLLAGAAAIYFLLPPPRARRLLAGAVLGLLDRPRRAADAAAGQGGEADAIFKEYKDQLARRGSKDLLDRVKVLHEDRWLSANGEQARRDILADLLTLGQEARARLGTLRPG